MNKANFYLLSRDGNKPFAIKNHGFDKPNLSSARLRKHILIKKLVKALVLCNSTS
ncbi:MAG: hypothetical protein WBA07_19915 [Rivularia sp. (in: cyanobacteria)]